MPQSLYHVKLAVPRETPLDGRYTSLIRDSEERRWQHTSFCPLRAFEAPVKQLANKKRGRTAPNSSRDRYVIPVSLIEPKVPVI